MKFSRSAYLSSPLSFVLVMALLPLAADTAQAENPFKRLGAKAKQGVSKVGKALNPRKIGAVIVRVKNAALEPDPQPRFRPVRTLPPLYPTTTNPSRTVTAPQTEPGGEPEFIRQLPAAGAAAPPALAPPATGATAPSGYYTKARYLEDAADREGANASTSPEQVTTDLELDASDSPVPPSAPSKLTVPADRTPPPFLSDSVPQQSSDSAAPPRSPPSPPSPPSALRQVHSAPSGASVQSPIPARPAGLREDLPYGQPVPGKTGFVSSPYSTKGFVDVSGIPVGTKVKCPYSGKIFRVP